MVRDRLRSLIDRPWRDIALPPDAVGIPTMLSKMERRVLYSLARDYASDDAAIVDAGSFLGGSTAALLAGVRDRAEPWTGPPVTSYDLFRVDDYMVPKYFWEDQSIGIGDSFRPRFDSHVSRFDVPHVVREGDITQIGWSGGPIDVLFLDILKSWEINDVVLRDFFPSLVPGRSVIVHQDYGWGQNPWIAITVELMRDSLVLLDWMEWGSHVYFVESEIASGVCQGGVGGLDIDAKIELIEQAASHAEGWVLGMLEISRAILVAERDGPEAALAELEAVRERHPQRGFVIGCIKGARAQIESGAAVR
jgi:hypothetical protein